MSEGLAAVKPCVPRKLASFLFDCCFFMHVVKDEDLSC